MMRWLLLAGISACGLFPDVSALSTDASIASDASNTKDASAEADAPAGFCASSTHVFCADFDEGSLLAGWSDNSVTAPAGSITLATDVTSSQPGSFLASMARRASSDPAEYALLDRDFDGWHHVVVDFDFFARMPDWQTGDINAGIFVFYFYSGSSSDGVAVSMGQGYTTIGNPGKDLNTAPIATGAWLHAHVDIDPAGTIDATFGAIHASGTFTALASGSTPTMSLLLGISGYNQPAPQFQIYYDNVTVDYL